MKRNVLKAGKAFKIAGVGVLIIVSLMSWAQARSCELKSKNIITCDGGPSDTIIFDQERSRTRAHLDSVTRVGFDMATLQQGDLDFPGTTVLALKTHNTNAYLRNIFYVYLISAVP